jgi:cell division cycle 20-like protein 1 (cofactor of APC complex)
MLDRRRLQALQMKDAAAEGDRPEPAPLAEPAGPALLQYSAAAQSPAPSPYSLSPLSSASQALLCSPQRPPRKIPKAPYKVLDAPELQDDFYLNLVDWGPSSFLSVGLSQCVYLWSAVSSQVNRLCEIGDGNVSSVRWMANGSTLAVGDSLGKVHIYDATRLTLLKTIKPHNARVGTLACTGNLVVSGSRDRRIALYDIRAPLALNAGLR